MCHALNRFEDPDLPPDADLNGVSVVGKIIERTADWTEDKVAFMRLLRLIASQATAKLAMT